MAYETLATNSSFEPAETSTDTLAPSSRALDDIVVLCGPLPPTDKTYSTPRLALDAAKRHAFNNGYILNTERAPRFTRHRYALRCYTVSELWKFQRIQVTHRCPVGVTVRLQEGRWVISNASATQHNHPFILRTAFREYKDRMPEERRTYIIDLYNRGFTYKDIMMQINEPALTRDSVAKTVQMYRNRVIKQNKGRIIDLSLRQQEPFSEVVRIIDVPFINEAVVEKVLKAHLKEEQENAKH